MKRRRSTAVSGILIALVSCALSVLLLEIALRLFFPVTDFPLAAYETDVGLHMAPNQSGTWVIGATGQVRGDYHINAAGWNSSREYVAEKAEGALRIAVIGDSYVEAFQVNVDWAFPALVERDLEARSACADYSAIEVYGFGMQGAPMSQYLSMMRYAAKRYDPDVYVISIAHNDFEPSVTGQAPHPHFLSFQQSSTGGFEEIPPVPYTPSKLRRFLVSFALARFAYGNLKMPDLLPRLRTLFASPGPDGGVARQTEEAGASNASAVVGLTMHIFGAFQEVARGGDSELLLVLDADREAIYEGEPPSSEALRYLQIVDNAATYLEIDYVDLYGPFAEDFLKRGEAFSSKVDYHWNERGHAVVGQVVTDWIVNSVCANSRTPDAFRTEWGGATLGHPLD